MSITRTSKIMRITISSVLAVLTLLMCMLIQPDVAYAIEKNITPGSTTVTVESNNYHGYLNNANTGNPLNGTVREYTTNDGITGYGYCVTHDRGTPNPTQPLKIISEYSHQTVVVGAFANGYPQHSLDVFINRLAQQHPMADGLNVSGLTQDEYEYATQMAVWVSLHQIALPQLPGRDMALSSEFYSGSTTLAMPSGAQQQRVFDAVLLILRNAIVWTLVPQPSVSIRFDDTKWDNYIALKKPVPDDVEHPGLDHYAFYELEGFKYETINGEKYITKEYVAGSRTSTFYNHNYTIDLWTENAPPDTIFVDLNNVPLNTRSSNGKTVFALPTSVRNAEVYGDTEEFYHNVEYGGKFKIAIKQTNAGLTGALKIHADVIAVQYDVYYAENPNATLQDVVLAQPTTTQKETYAEIKWEDRLDPKGSLRVFKSSDSGVPLVGATFELDDGKGGILTRTTDAQGIAVWDNLLDPSIVYTLRETIAPAGYLPIEPQQVTVTANTTLPLHITDSSIRNFIIRKTDAKTGGPLGGAIFRFENITTGYITTATTGNDGLIKFTGSLLPFGGYKITEQQAPPGYTLDNHVETVNWDGKNDITLNFVNMPGIQIILRKVDLGTHAALAGATFSVYRDTTYVTSVTTNEQGEAIVNNVTEGTYKFVETIAPKGYLLDPTPHEIYVNGYDPLTDPVPVITVENDPKPSMRIIKLDRITNTPIEGAGFNIKRDGTDLGDFYTDADGIIPLNEILPGTYLITEFYVDAQHIVDNTPYEIEITAEDIAANRPPVTVYFYNNVKPGVRITKIDSETKKPLENALFRIKQIEGTYDQELLTDIHGEIDLSFLEPDAYEIWETQAPTGYLVDGPVRIIKLSENENAEYVFGDYRKPTLEVLKYDGNLGIYLPGAAFEIVRIGDGSHYLDRVTDERGRISIPDLFPGVYSVKETVAPAGYTLNPEEFHVLLIPGHTSQLVVHDLKKPSLIIKKYDGDTAEPLANAEFSLSEINGSIIWEGLTGADGTVTIPNLEPGDYKIREIGAPPGYLLLSFPKDVRLDAGRDTEVKFDNWIKPQLIIYKYDKDTAQLLPNAEFSIAKVNGSVIYEGVTDAEGKITLSGLDFGDYVITEIAPPPGYIAVTEPRNVRLEPGKVLEVKFDNRKKPDLQIVKTDAITGAPIAGVTYEVREDDSTEVKSVTTDSKGEVLLKELNPGVYEVREVGVPDNYLIAKEPVKSITLTPAITGIVRYQNYKKPTLTINKVDSITRDPIKNVKFSVQYASNSSFTGELRDLGTYFTDASGQIVLERQTDGWYRITEITPSSGYTIKGSATQDIFVEAGRDKTAIFENTPKSAIIVKKIDNETGLPVSDATFSVKFLGGMSGSGGTVIHEGVTSVNGTIVLAGLKPGTYVIEETRAATGYELSNPTVQTAIITDDEQSVVQLTFSNKHTGNLLILKKDSATKQPVAGATFKVSFSDGSVIGASNGEYTTDTEGGINLAENLPVGSTIVVQEIKAPDGYVLDSTAQTIKIKENTTHTLTFYNSPKSGIQILKLDAVTRQPLSGAHFSVSKKTGDLIGDYVTDGDGLVRIPELDPGWIKIVETRAPSGYLLAEPQDVEIVSNQYLKIVFEDVPQAGLQILKIDETTHHPIPGVEFAISKMNGERLGTYTTDAKGEIHIPGVSAGWLEITEIKAAQGYLFDKTIHKIEVSNSGTASITITNKKASGIMLHKVDSATGKGIYGVTFLLYDSGKNPLQQYVSDQDGYVYIGREEQLSAGKYFLSELKPAEGYQPDDELKTIYIEAGKTSQITWKNTPITGQIQLLKYSAEYNPVSGTPAGTPLKGAVYEITQSRSGTVVGYITTDARGVAASPPLPLGRYFLKEVTAPAFFQVSSERLEAELEYPGQIIRLSAYDKSAILGTEIKKTGNKEIIAGDTMRYDISVANTSNVPLSDFYWSDRLPTDAARIQTLVTGTYNQRVYYRVMYKTNSGQWRTLKSNLLSTNNYSFNLSANVLGLAGGEVVTEIKLEFGTVQAGFASVTKPMITVATLPTLPKGYQITNRAQVSGVYQGAPQESTTSWTTKVVRFDPPVGKLPKTGY